MIRPEEGSDLSCSVLTILVGAKARACVFAGRVARLWSLSGSWWGWVASPGGRVRAVVRVGDSCASTPSTVFFYQFGRRRFLLASKPTRTSLQWPKGKIYCADKYVSTCDSCEPRTPISTFRPCPSTHRIIRACRPKPRRNPVSGAIKLEADRLRGPKRWPLHVTIAFPSRHSRPPIRRQSRGSRLSPPGARTRTGNMPFERIRRAASPSAVRIPTAAPATATSTIASTMSTNTEREPFPMRNLSPCSTGDNCPGYDAADEAGDEPPTTVVIPRPMVIAPQKAPPRNELVSPMRNALQLH